jgi:hypothetical protein
MILIRDIVKLRLMRRNNYVRDSEESSSWDVSKQEHADIFSSIFNSLSKSGGQHSHAKAIQSVSNLSVSH